MAKRVGWGNLSPAQRARYLGAGKSGSLSGVPLSPAQVRRYYERGGDLRGGRGHLAIPKRAAPLAETNRVSIGLGDTADRKILEKWRRSKSYPNWLPRSESAIGYDTAAILSQIPYPPAQWKEAILERVPGTQSYTFTVVPKGKGRASRQVLLPDYDSTQDLSALLNASTRAKLGTKADQRRFTREWQTAKGKPVSILVTWTGTDENVRGSESPPPTETRGRGAFGEKTEAPAKKAPAKKATTTTKRSPRKVKKATKRSALRELLSEVSREDLLAELGVGDLISEAVRQATQESARQIDALTKRLEDLEAQLRKGR